MKAWGSKKIFRSGELTGLEPWQADALSGPSVQRPYLRMKEFVEVLGTEAADPVAEVPASLEASAEPMPEAELSPPVPLVPMIEETELARIREAARQEGYEAGFEAGRQSGYAAGEASGREAGHAAGLISGEQAGRQLADADVARFQALCQSLTAAIAAYEDALALPIRDLGIAVAQQIVRTQITTQPESLQTVIREAIASLPELHGPLKVTLHPDDVALVQDFLAHEGTHATWRLEPSEAMERGGCRINHATVELDLSLPTRWRRIIESLGSDEPWQAGDGHKSN
ncbi:flagellar assembly protein FliH [Chitinimonas sp. BJYL2]|uniref:flagellar assembly protein FliH n=1 Tax=Chitinimonas sp. BJYL2 TaxID=2976696 RepID=UPI0022B47344|nr:flagellar assembly protein FliH [Chitinimonas sp. BJYL2]